MPSNLTIKYGDKTGAWTDQSKTAPINSAASASSAGNIYAAKNSVGEIEMYIDTPVDDTHSSTERKRLDPRIFVGDLSDVDAPAGTSDAAKRAMIWDNYDVWIDTSGDPTGNATTTSDGLMSSTHVGVLTDTANTLSALKAELDKLKLQIVSQSYWNNSSAATGSSSGTALNDMLTIVLPDSAVPSGQTANTYVFETIDTSSIVVPDIDLARNNSNGFGDDGGI